MIIISIVFGSILVVVLAISLYGSFQITQVPRLATPYTPADFGWRYEDVSFTTVDGLRLTGWFVPADAPSPMTIVIHHGLGSNAGDSLLNTACLRHGGRWNLFYYNFRGHDGSQGNGTSLGPLELRDLDGALAWLQQAKPEACDQLGIYGHSLGAAVAIVGAAAHPELKGVIAESPFASLSDTVRHFSKLFYGIPWFPFIPLALFFASCRLRCWLFAFAPVKSIGKISPRAVFLIQGERDRRIPMRDARALWAAAREPKEWWGVPGADHGDPWMIAKDDYETRLVGFFEKVFGPPAGG